jgi:hypothetical protein
VQPYSCHLAKSLHSFGVPLLSLLENNSALVIYVDNHVPGRTITRLGHSSLHLQFAKRSPSESFQSGQMQSGVLARSGKSVALNAVMEF